MNPTTRRGRATDAPDLHSTASCLFASNGTPSEAAQAITEARVRAEAIATVVSADLLDRGGVDTETAVWVVDMADQVARWIDRSRVAA